VNRPRWDGRHTLFWGGQPILELGREAPCEMLALAAFQRQGWPAEIDLASIVATATSEALKTYVLSDPSQWLRNTTGNLNRHVERVRFHYSARGQTMRWEEVP
jgi:hypothetical protein